MIKRRFAPIVANALRYGLLQVGGLLLSVLVVRGFSDALWGSFALLQVQVALGAIWANWGHRDYLLRRFVEQPNLEKVLWCENIASRMLLLAVPVAVFAMLHFTEPNLFGWLALWLLALFFLQSFDLLVVVHRRFAAATWAEVAGLLVTLVGLAVSWPAWYPLWLVQCWFFGALARVAVFVFLLRGHIFPLPPWRWGSAHLIQSWPFFLIGLSGMLVSRLDLLAVGSVLSDTETGRYQIIMSLLIVMQLPAALLVMPFVKQLYRLPMASLRRFSRKTMLLGLLILLVASPLCWILLRWGYGFELPAYWVLAGLFFALPVYAYVPLSYRLYQKGQERYVLSVGIVGALCGAGLAYALAAGPLGIAGGWLAQSLIQWAIWQAYRFRLKEAYARPDSGLSGQANHVDQRE